MSLEVGSEVVWAPKLMHGRVVSIGPDGACSLSVVPIIREGDQPPPKPVVIATNARWLEWNDEFKRYVLGLPKPRSKRAAVVTPDVIAAAFKASRPGA